MTRKQQRNRKRAARMRSLLVRITQSYDGWIIEAIGKGTYTDVIAVANEIEAYERERATKLLRVCFDIPISAGPVMMTKWVRRGVRT